jgi:carboxylate-amine ligase
VFDTPLTVERAAVLAAYAQTLSRYLLVERPPTAGEEIYNVYNYNRFQACRFGFDGFLIDPSSQSHKPIREDILETVAALAIHARELESSAAVGEVARWAREGVNDARWLRERYAGSQSLEDVVWQQGRRWRGQD